ncbi:MAG: HupE/UreJ family protein [Verrucomicrobiota bacterium]
MKFKFVALILSILFALCPSTRADEFRPALLEIIERDGGWVDVTWKVPMRSDKVLAVKPLLPGFLEAMGPGSGRRVPGAWIETASYRAGDKTLNGSTLKMEGLSAVPVDVLVRITLKDGTQHSTIMRSGSTSYTIPEKVTNKQLAFSYLRMGTIHILEGYDHLLFLLALLLIVSGFRKLLWTITAFTLAHSITLGLATLGLVHVPSAPTEAVISLSILFLAAEIIRLRAGEKPLTAKYPWVVAFSFGLIHGLGFAGALSEIGVPQNAVPLALVMFNVGVEIGQIAFVTVVAALIALTKRFIMPSHEFTGKLVPYAIGAVATFWTIERTLSFL